jgi:nicotinamidase-related amidase
VTGEDGNGAGRGGSGRSALIVVDVLNRYEHADAEPLRRSMAGAMPAMRALIAQAREAGTEIVYVNDNYGDWSAGRIELRERALDGQDPSLVEPLLPPDDAAFVTKARHSIFYETPLDYLLRGKDVQRLVLTGQVTEQCILYSALDGYVRHYSIVVPADAVAHIHSDLAQAALRMMATNMRAEITSAAKVHSGAAGRLAGAGGG